MIVLGEVSNIRSFSLIVSTFFTRRRSKLSQLLNRFVWKNARNNGEKSTNIGWLVAWMRWKPASCSWVGNSFPKAKVGLAMPSCRRMPHIAPNVARCRLIEWKGGGFLDAENFGAFFQRLLSSKPWRFGERVLHWGPKNGSGLLVTTCHWTSSWRQHFRWDNRCGYGLHLKIKWSSKSQAESQVCFCSRNLQVFFYGQAWQGAPRDWVPFIFASLDEAPSDCPIFLMTSNLDLMD